MTIRKGIKIMTRAKLLQNYFCVTILMIFIKPLKYVNFGFHMRRRNRTVSITNFVFSCSDRIGRTVLHFAATIQPESVRLEMFAFLEQHGAPKNKK